MSSPDYNQRQRDKITSSNAYRYGSAPEQDKPKPEPKRSDDPEFVLFRQAKEEGQKQGVDVHSATVKTTQEGNQQVSRISNIRGTESKQHRNERISEAEDQARFETFKSIKEQGDRQGYDVNSATFHSKTTPTGSIEIRASNVKATDNLMFGSLTRDHARDQIANYHPIDIALPKDENAGAADFAIMTPKQGGRGRYEGVESSGQISEIAISKQGNTTNLTSIRRQPGYTEFSSKQFTKDDLILDINPKVNGMTLTKANDELLLDFRPTGRFTQPIEKGPLSTKDMFGPGDDTDVRSYVGNEAENFIVLAQEIGRGNFTLDPYKKWRADSIAADKGLPVYKSHTTTFGSITNFGVDSVLDFASGKGYKPERWETLVQEIKENPARTFGSALGGLPFFFTPIPKGIGSGITGALKSGASKLSTGINARLIEASLVAAPKSSKAIDAARSETSIFRSYPNWEGMRNLEETFGVSFTRSKAASTDISNRIVSPLSSTEKLIDVEARRTSLTSPIREGVRPMTEREAFGSSISSKEQFTDLFESKATTPARRVESIAPDLTIEPLDIKQLGIKGSEIIKNDKTPPTVIEPERDFAIFGGKAGSFNPRTFVPGSKRSVPSLGFGEYTETPIDLLAGRQSPLSSFFKAEPRATLPKPATTFGVLGAMPGKSMPRVFVSDFERSISSFGYGEYTETPIDLLAGRKSPLSGFFNEEKAGLTRPNIKMENFGVLTSKPGSFNPRTYVPGGKRTLPTFGPQGENTITPIEQLAGGKAPIETEITKFLGLKNTGSKSLLNGALGSKAGYFSPRTYVPGSKRTLPSFGYGEYTETPIEWLAASKAPIENRSFARIFGDLTPIKKADRVGLDDLKKIMDIEERKTPIFNTENLTKDAEINALFKGGLKQSRNTRRSSEPFKPLEQKKVKEEGKERSVGSGLIQIQKLEKKSLLSNKKESVLKIRSEPNNEGYPTSGILASSKNRSKDEGYTIFPTYPPGKEEKGSLSALTRSLSSSKTEIMPSLKSGSILNNDFTPRSGLKDFSRMFSATGLKASNLTESGLSFSVDLGRDSRQDSKQAFSVDVPPIFPNVSKLEFGGGFDFRTRQDEKIIRTNLPELPDGLFAFGERKSKKRKKKGKMKVSLRTFYTPDTLASTIGPETKLGRRLNRIANPEFY